jgi:chromosome segregation ATPase
MKFLMSSALVVLLGGLAFGQPPLPIPVPPGPDQNLPQPDLEPRERPPRFEGFRRGAVARDMFSSGGQGMMMRQFVSEELSHVPSLQSKLQRVIQLQQEKANLEQKLRQSVQGAGRETRWTDFHELLGRQDAVTTKMLELLAEFSRDSDRLHEEVARRRQEIGSQIDELRRNRPEGTGEARDDTPEMRTLNRGLRFYDFVLDRLAVLHENPQRIEWLRSLLRGSLGNDTADMQVVQQALRRLQQLEQDQEELRRSMQQVEGQIAELRETLEAVSMPSSRRAGPMNARVPGAGDPLGQGPRGMDLTRPPLRQPQDVRNEEPPN